MLNCIVTLLNCTTASLNQTVAGIELYLLHQQMLNSIPYNLIQQSNSIETAMTVQCYFFLFDGAVLQFNKIAIQFNKIAKYFNEDKQKLYNTIQNNLNFKMV